MIRTLGLGVIGWMQTMLCHGPGDVEGEPLVLDDEFRRFILEAYRVNDEGKRLYRRVVLSRPKGRAKSELAGALVCAEALGPVRFGGWRSDGQPIGRAVAHPEIVCVATEEDQTGNTYDHVRFMLRHGRVATEFPDLDVGLSRVLLTPSGEITPATSSASARDGARSTFAVFDETHLWFTPELHRLHRTIVRNLAKRARGEPWSLETSTMYAPGQRSVAEASHKHATAVGEGRAIDTGLLFDHRQAPLVDRHDTEALREALREVYGPAAAWMDLDRIIRDIQDEQADWADSQRYWLNRPVITHEQWIDPELWQACANEAEEVQDGEVVTLGFDGSRWDDATALVACRVRDGHVFVPRLGDRPTVWERPEGDAPWEVPESEVDAAVAAAFERWDVRRLYADPPMWSDTIGRWRNEFGEKRVTPWWTNRLAQAAYAVERLETAITTASMSHDATPVLTRHVENTRADRNRWGKKLRKESEHSALKIDATMAMVLAYESRGDVISAGEDKPRRSAYAGGRRLTVAR